MMGGLEVFGADGCAVYHAYSQYHSRGASLACGFIGGCRECGVAWGDDSLIDKAQLLPPAEQKTEAQSRMGL